MIGLLSSKQANKQTSRQADVLKRQIMETKCNHKLFLIAPKLRFSKVLFYLFQPNFKLPRQFGGFQTLESDLLSRFGIETISQ